MGWWLKDRDADNEINARIQGNQQIQEGTKLLADMVEKQALEVANETKRAADEQESLQAAAAEKQARLDKANQDVATAQGRLQELKGESAHKADQISAFTEQIQALQDKSATSNSLNCCECGISPEPETRGRLGEVGR